MSEGHFNIESMPVFTIIAIILIVGFLILVFMALAVWLHCRIFAKAGYNWAFGLLILVPLGQLIILLILAFGQWPIHQQMQILQDQSNPS